MTFIENSADILKAKILSTFPLRLGVRQECSFSPFVFKITVEVLPLNYDKK